MIQKLSTRMPSLESRMKALKDIASENGIVLQLEEASSPVEVYNLRQQNFQFYCLEHLQNNYLWLLM